MGLYYAPAIFVYLLSLCIPRLARPNIPLLASLGIVVIGTFTAMFLPFLLPNAVIKTLASDDLSALKDLNIWSMKNWDIETPVQIFTRIFPFGRGLWEDKVANTWCATNTLIKWRQLYSTPFLQKLRSIPYTPLRKTKQILTSSLGTTLVSITPGLMYIFTHPHIKHLPRIFTLSALGFFLFSFQVHEKSILLPLMPASLLLFSTDAEERKWTVWINVIGTVRYPLTT
jgi:alpha-1,3-glucosyltransferase